MSFNAGSGSRLDDEIGRRRDVGGETQEFGPLLEDVILLLRLTRLSRGGERGERDKPCGGESPRPASVSVALGANHAKHFSFRKS